MKRGGIFLATRMALGLMAALAVSACAKDNDGSTATLPIPKAQARVMLEKLDLNVPTDLDMTDSGTAAQRRFMPPRPRSTRWPVRKAPTTLRARSIA